MGAWNIIDLYLHKCGYCWQRELFYIFIPSFLLFFTQEIFSRESLIWFFTHGNPFKTHVLRSQLLTEYSHDIELECITPHENNNNNENENYDYSCYSDSDLNDLVSPSS